MTITDIKTAHAAAVETADNDAVKAIVRRVKEQLKVLVKEKFGLSLQR